MTDVSVAVSRDSTGATYAVNGKIVLQLKRAVSESSSCVNKQIEVRDDVFPNAVAKLRRAEFHLSTIEEELGAYWRRVTFQYLTEIDQRSREVVFRIACSESLPSDLGPMISDFLNNIRAALNLLIADQVVSNGQSISQQNAFPASRTKKDFEREVEKRLTNTTSDFQRFVRRLRPYGGDGNSLFWRLSEMRNTNDHHFIMPVLIGGITMSMIAGTPMLSIGPDGAYYLGGGPPGSVPMGYEQGLMVPEGAQEVVLSHKGPTEIFRGHEYIIHLSIVPHVQMKVLIGQDAGSISVLHDFHRLVRRVISTSQCRFAGNLKN